MSTDLYKRKRNAFYKKITKYWHDLYGMEYSLYHVHRISEREIEEIREATDRIGKLFYKTARLLRQADDETLTGLGIPKETLEIIRLKPIRTESVIARLDLVRTSEGYKLLEMNSDTPTFIKECFEVNGLVCEEFGATDPNEGAKAQLKSALDRAIIESAAFVKAEYPNVVFTAHHDHEEDWNTSLFLKELTSIPAKLVPLAELFIDESGLYDHEGERIDVLYRQTYPLEHLIFDRDGASGMQVGQMLLRLVRERKVSIVNPPSAFLLQSKAVMALIWGIYESDKAMEVYTDEEQKWIKQYLLPTYLENDRFIGRSMYVKKPAFGREGDTVEISDQKGKVIHRNRLTTYQEELPVYQQYINLPQVEVETEKGLENLHYIVGSFLIGGKASAIGLRAGGQITGNESYFLPVGY